MTYSLALSIGCPSHYGSDFAWNITKLRPEVLGIKNFKGTHLARHYIKDFIKAVVVKLEINQCTSNPCIDDEAIF